MLKGLDSDSKYHKFELQDIGLVFLFQRFDYHRGRVYFLLAWCRYRLQVTMQTHLNATKIHLSL